MSNNIITSYSLLGKSYGFYSGSHSFINLVLANVTNYIQHLVSKLIPSK